MSNYVERVLQPGEQVRHLATIHWITYVPGLAVLVVSLGVLYAASLSLPGGEKLWQILSAALAVFAVILIFRAWFHRWITEIAVTDRRVIYIHALHAADPEAVRRELKDGLERRLLAVMRGKVR